MYNAYFMLGPAGRSLAVGRVLYCPSGNLPRKGLLNRFWESNMSETNTTERQKAPWHLWVVGIAGLLWSAMGAMDYVMTQTRNEQYMSNFTPEQLEFFYGIPAWAVATWAIAVWGGVLGCLLLLFRTRHAVGVLLASLICMVITTVENYVIRNGMEVIGDPFALGFSALIFLIALGLVVYARMMYKLRVII